MAIDFHTEYWEKKRVERLEEELRRAIYFKNGGVVMRYPVGLTGMWRYNAWNGRRFKPKPNELDIEKMVRLRKFAMQNGKVEMQKLVEESLLDYGIVIDDATGKWRREESE